MKVHCPPRADDAHSARVSSCLTPGLIAIDGCANRPSISSALASLSKHTQQAQQQGARQEGRAHFSKQQAASSKVINQHVHVQAAADLIESFIDRSIDRGTPSRPSSSMSAAASPSRRYQPLPGGPIPIISPKALSAAHETRLLRCVRACVHAPAASTECDGAIRLDAPLLHLNRPPSTLSCPLGGWASAPPASSCSTSGRG